MKKVLVISPHMDDAEYAMGGTLLRHRDFGDEITLAVTHADDNLAGDVSVRMEEQKESSLILKTKRIIYFDKKVSIEERVSVLDKTEPDIIYFPFEKDPHHHHVEASNLGLSVSRNFNISVFKYITQRSYDYFPNYYQGIDIVEKIRLVSVFKSQNGRQPKFIEIMEAQNRFFGSLIPGNGHYAEGFVLFRQVQI